MTALQPSSIPAAGFDSVPFRSLDVSEEFLEGELLLYRSSDTRAIYLNATAAIIWLLCDGQRSVRAIVDLIDESYPDADPALAGDVLGTLNSLRDNHVLLWS